jgi:hypothetical protein
MRKIISYDKKNKKRLLAITAAASAIMLVVGIGTIGQAPLSVQQQQQSPSSERTPGPKITSGNIEDETIVSADLKDGAAVRSSDIVDGQVTTQDLADDAVTSDKIEDGAISLETIRVPGEIETVSAGSPGAATVDCPPGTTLTGGGYRASLPVMTQQDEPTQQFDYQWFVLVQNPNPVEVEVQAFALCGSIVS